MFALVVIVLAVGVRHVALCKEFRVRSVSKFDKLVSKYRYAVVMLYRSDKETKRDSELRQKIKDLQVMFKSLSKVSRYKETDLQFLNVNVAKKDLSEVMQRLGIQTVPTFVLFNGGVPIRDQNKHIAKLQGSVYRNQLQEFIEKHLSEQLEDVIEAKEKERKRKLEEARIRYYEQPYYPYGYPGYYYYYPYGYRYYRHYYPHWQVGFGIGW